MENLYSVALKWIAFFFFFQIYLLVKLYENTAMGTIIKGIIFVEFLFVVFYLQFMTSFTWLSNVHTVLPDNT